MVYFGGGSTHHGGIEDIEVHRESPCKLPVLSASYVRRRRACFIFFDPITTNGFS